MPRVYANNIDNPKLNHDGFSYDLEKSINNKQYWCCEKKGIVQRTCCYCFEWRKL